MPSFGPISSDPISESSEEDIGSLSSSHSIHKGWRHRIYQATSAPVWHPDLVAEETTIDRYEVSWRTPIWKVKQPIHTPGSFIDDSVIPPDPIPRDYRPWHVEFSEPVLPKFKAYYYPWSYLDLEPSQQPEEVTIDRFYSEFSQPFFPLSKRYRVHLFQYNARVDFPGFVDETIYVPSFMAQFDIPILQRKRSILYPIGVIQLTDGQFGETICVCSFESSWGQPIFLRLPQRPYLDGIVISPDFFPALNAKFADVMLAGGLHWLGF